MQSIIYFEQKSQGSTYLKTNFKQYAGNDLVAYLFLMAVKVITCRKMTINFILKSGGKK